MHHQLIAFCIAIGLLIVGLIISNLKKVLIVTIYPEETGLKNYHLNFSCPIATGLKRLGYEKVFVTRDKWRAKKSLLWGLINIPVSGKISDEANNIAIDIAMNISDNIIMFRIK